MIPTSQAFREAIVGSPRRIDLLAVVDISDPDKTYLPVTCSPEAPWSRREQLRNCELASPPLMATLERNFWLGDGSFDLFPDDYSLPDEVGYASEILSGPSGAFSEPFPWVQLNFTNVGIIQALSIVFSGNLAEGVPADFTVEVFAGDQLYYTKDVTGNTDTQIQLGGFTVYYPTAIRVTVRAWTLPFRRARLVELVMGYFERWTSDMLYSFSATLQGQFSCLSLPYGSATVAMDNVDRRFEPRRKDSIFQSIEERQGVDLFLGCRTSTGTERVKLGVFYQAGDGWKTSENSPVMSWYLVDIIGLIANRTFVLPRNGDTLLPLPTTLEGWLRALVSQLGPAFENRYKVDPDYANKPVTALHPEDVTGKKCGDILRWACQVTGTWPRARQEDGALTAEPLWNQGNKLTLDNLEKYPTMKANKSLAALIFQLAVSGEATEEDPDPPTQQKQFVVSGNSTSSEETVTIINPFLHTTEQALAAARLILAQYGGNILETTGRGDPSSEIGDVDTVWLDESNATTARRMMQTFEIQGGVLRGCRSTLLQADGSYLWENFAVIRESGVWTSPPGVRQLRVVIGRGGQGGGPGEDGWVGPTGNLWGSGVGSGYGEDGVDGQGGEIWYGIVPCNEEQQFQVTLGAGGAPGSTVGQPGARGQHSTFGPYSSENGRLYENGYTDIANGQVFARSGVPAPLPGTGDGGKGGEGGEPGAGHFKSYSYTVPGGFKPDGSPVVNTRYEFIITKEPGKGKPGAPGATGFVMVTWDKVETEADLKR